MQTQTVYGVRWIKFCDAISMPGSFNPASSLDFVAHIIHVALTPIFLLSGIATLLNMSSTRLARAADWVDQISKAIEGADPVGDIAVLTRTAVTSAAKVHRA